MHVTVERADPACRDHLELVVAGGRDPELVHNTYLPPLADVDAAATWLADQRRCWVVRDGGAAAGMVTLHLPVDSGTVDVPAGSVESEVWLLQQFRGRGTATVAYRLIEPELGEDCTYLVAVIWKHNKASLRRVLTDGYHWLGDTWWGGSTDGGMCEVWARQLGTTGPSGT